MIIKSTAVDPFFLALDTLFQRGYMNAETTYQMWAQTVPSSTKKQLHAWLDRLPKLREWIGPRVVNNIVVQNYELENKPYEDTVAINRYDVDDDEHGLYAPTIELMGTEAAKWPDHVMTDTLVDGVNQVTFDDTEFFSDSHPVDTANPGAYPLQSNLFTTATGDPMPLGGGNAAASIAKMRARMRTFKGRDGLPIGANLTHVVVPAAKEQEARQVANTEFLVQNLGGNLATGSQTNVLKGTFDVIVNPLLTDDDDWFGFDLRWPIKPLIWQLRKSPELVTRVAPTDPSVFDDNNYKYGVDARGVGGYGLWFFAAKGGV
jgi:phage major head subunit gpT-like protein